MDCFDECPFLCQEVEIKRQIVSSKWPDKSSILPFYDRYVANYPFEENYAEYRTIKAMSLNASLQQEAIKLIRETSLIEDNFARVDFYLGSHTLVNMKDTKKYTNTDLFSTLGGTLNLYCGITFIIVIEIFELIFRVFYRKRAEKKEKIKKKIEMEKKANEVVPFRAFETTQYSKQSDFSQRY